MKGYGFCLDVGRETGKGRIGTVSLSFLTVWETFSVSQDVCADPGYIRSLFHISSDFLSLESKYWSPNLQTTMTSSMLIFHSLYI